MKFLKRFLGDPRSETRLLKLFGFTKVWLIWAVGVRIVKINDNEIEAVIPLNRKTRNHLNSMYFGALAIGSDIAGGYLAVRQMVKNDFNMSFVFKDLKAEFKKRAEGDVHFNCRDGARMVEAVHEAQRTKERVNIPIEVTATVPEKLGEELVAKFDLTFSVKARS